MLPRTITRNFSINSRLMVSFNAKAIVYNEHGEPKDVLKSHSYTLSSENLKPDEVILQTLASPINPSDINQIQGIYPSKPPISIESLPELESAAAVCGNEGLFKVVAKGSNVADLEINDWCIPSSVNFGTWCSYRLANKAQLMKMPKTISKEQAATIAVNPSSAYQMLTMYEKLSPGDWFIQNGGTSQVGRAAIQIGKKLGLNSISIVRDRDDIDATIAELKALGATQVITETQNNSKDFGPTIKSWLDGKTIKLGLNCVGGSSATGLARKLGSDATMLTYGAMSMKPVSLPTSLFIFKNLTAKGFWITENIKRDPSSRKTTIDAVLKLMEDGDLVDAKPCENIIQSDSVSNDEFAATFYKSLGSKGKQLIVFQ
ncbi:enoyl-[acyl-carrier-protein] reductase [Martiniozyma asiatica (nom. inval.)]|nr:enoyl-[acyl-carrier-protein] reductase [Martiniozyma asiatica]